MRIGLIGRRAIAQAKACGSGRHRRRGSILVLVITVLSILFVMGVAFLASMNFEADAIVGEQQRERVETGAGDAMLGVATILRNDLIARSAKAGEGRGVDVPDDHSLAAPIEPYRDSTGNLVYGWFTDAEWLLTGKHETAYDPGYRIDTTHVSGEPVGFSPAPPAYTIPVDADGDGISDALAVDAEYLNYSPTQRAQLSAIVNDPAASTSRVYLGLRIVPHGGMVNLNDAHPLLIQSVFALEWWPVQGEPRDVELKFFRHSPLQTANQPPAVQAFYSSPIEEPLLRRRGFLPPRTIPPSLLFGSAFADPRRSPPGEGDMPGQLFWPTPSAIETVFANAHRYYPFSPDLNEDPHPRDTNFLTWEVRMNPFVASDIETTPQRKLTRPEYDRRHLVTTISHDDLLSRGQVVKYLIDDGDGNIVPVERDVIDLMIEANREEFNRTGSCDLLPFEYPDYPSSDARDSCQCVSPDSVIHRACFDDEHPTLQLSLAELDNISDVCNTLSSPEREDCFDDRNRLIHDAFLMLVSNASGPYWNNPGDNWCVTDEDCGDPANAECRYFRDIAGIPFGQCFDRLAGLVLRTCDDCGVGGSGCTGVLGTDAAGAGMTFNQCMDPAMNQPPGSSAGRRRDALISRTAASLTANMIDYMDLATCVGGTRDGSPWCLSNSDCPGGACVDDVPTRIALRSTNFRERTCHGGNDGQVCATDADCSGGLCRLSAGKAFGEIGLKNRPPRYVYGLEKQPYITEIATMVSDSADPQVLSARAVELFNPYGDDIKPSGGDYALIPVDDSGAPQQRVPLTNAMVLHAGEFSALVEGDAAIVIVPPSTGTGRVYPLSGTPALAFRAGWSIYLVRRVQYSTCTGGMRPGLPCAVNDDCDGAGTCGLVATDIVLDQVKIAPNDCIGLVPSERNENAACTGQPLFSMERVVKNPLLTGKSVWTATIPQQGEQPGNTLGDYNLRTDDELHPVEVQFANVDNGTFARRDPDLPISKDPVAFPSTGSMLLLMRHANRSFNEYAVGPNEELAFAVALGGIISVSDGARQVPVEERYQIDNGRMPIFDRGAIDATLGRRAAHHVAPNALPTAVPPLREAEGIESLPWGQLVFDYFTALPLSDPGPYRTLAQHGNFKTDDGIPRVDRQGLRVHGRIDLNAAPWTVMQGLPFVPMERIPDAYRPKVRDQLGYVKPSAPDPLALDIAPNDLYVQNDKATWIGEQLAQAIVAYREARQVATASTFTGDYAANSVGRGWTDPSPAFRRGTGFLSIGELANVRHRNAQPTGAGSWYRADSGLVNPDMADGADYVRAVAVLVALGDWVTTRSHVHTVYGTIRGERDQGIGPMQQQVEDVDARAIRFQETVDRLDTIFGDPSLRRIGPRTISKMRDFSND